jgi:putative membrane protein
MPLVGPLPTPSRFGNGAKLIYVIAVRFLGAVLANVLIWSGSPPLSGLRTETEHGISALADQGAAGAVMMVEGGLVTLGIFAWLFFRWARQDTERQELIDLAERHGVPLDPERAARASAGRAKELAAWIRSQPVGR